MEDEEELNRRKEFSSGEEFVTQERLEELEQREGREHDDPASVIENARRQLSLPLSQMEGVKKEDILKERVSIQLLEMRKKYPERFGELETSGQNLLSTNNYRDILNYLQNQIHQIGSFTVTVNNQPYSIDLAQADAENTFTCPTGDSVKIKWHTDRFESIINKLKRTDLWRGFREDDNIKKFLKLKYRHSLLEGVITEEISKVSEEMYDSQIMLNWLEIDEKDPTRTSRPLRILCEKILEPKTLERLSYEDPGNVETRALLKQIIMLSNNPDTSKQLRELLEKHAEEDENIDEKTEEIVKTLKDFDANYRKDISKFDLQTRVQKSRPEKMSVLCDKMIESIIQVGASIKRYENISRGPGGHLDAILANNFTTREQNFIRRLMRQAETQPTFITLEEKEDFIKEFNKNYRSHPKTLVSTSRALTKLTDALSSQKDKTGEKKDQILKNLPPRALLYVIVEDELKRAGITVKTGLHRQAILRTNLLIAACETSDRAKLANSAIANELKTGFGSALKKSLDRVRASRYFSPLFTLKDALDHTVETVPELQIFRNINVLSTRADLMKNILQYESETQKEVTPAELRKFAGYLEQFIKGARIEGKVFKVLDHEVPKIENIIHILRLVAEERMARKFIADLNDREININELKEKDRLRVVLDLLKQKNAARNRMDKSIEKSIENRRQNFYRFFLAKNLKKEFNEAIEQTEDMGRAMRQAELLSRGLTKKLRKRGAVSIRSPHIAEKAVKVFALTCTVPLWWPSRGAYRLLRRAKDRWITPVFQSKEFQKRAAEQKEMRKGMFVEPLAKIVGAVPYFATWALTRPKYWLRGISAKLSKKPAK